MEIKNPLISRGNRMIFDIWGPERRRGLTAGDKNYLIRLARGKCEYCKKDIIGKGITPNIHHIFAWASGGSDREHNLIVLCPDCHSRVDQIPRSELRLRIEYRLPKKASAQSTTKGEATIKKAVVKRAIPKKTTKTKAAPKKKTAVRKAPIKKTVTKKTVERKTAGRRAVAKKAP